MQMGFRWYGEGNDQIKLSDIKQIPGVSTIVWALHHKMPGEIWEEEEIAEVMEQVLCKTSIERSDTYAVLQETDARARALAREYIGERYDK